MMSKHQMQSLCFDLKMRPEGIYLTSNHVHAQNGILPMSTSCHSVFERKRLVVVVELTDENFKKFETFYSSIDFDAQLELVEPKGRGDQLRYTCVQMNRRKLGRPSRYCDDCR